MPNHYKTLNEIPPNLKKKKKKKINRPRSHHHILSPTNVQRPHRDSHCFSRHCKHTHSHSHSHSQTNQNTQTEKKNNKKREREKNIKSEKWLSKKLRKCLQRKFADASTKLLRYSKSEKIIKKQIQQNKIKKKKLSIYFFIFSLKVFHFPAFFSIFSLFLFFAFLIYSNPRHTHFFLFFSSVLVLFSVWLLRKTKGKIKNKKTNQDGFSGVLTFCYFLIKVKLYISLLLFVSFG